MRFFFFLFNDPATTEIYTLSLHDALPICYQPDQQNGALQFPVHVQRNAFRYTASLYSRTRFSLLRLTRRDRKSTRLNSSHITISYAVFCLKKKKIKHELHLQQINKKTLYK